MVHPSTTSDPDPLLTPEESANLLRVSPGTLAVWRTTGRYNLPFVKCGGRVRYRLTDIQAFINSRLRNGHNDAD